MKRDFKAIITKYLPLIITCFVILLTGLSFIGNFFELRLKQDGVKTDTLINFASILFSNDAGINVMVYFIIIYLVMPIIGCLFLLLNKIHHNFSVISLVIFLLIGIATIVSKDVYASGRQVASDYLDYSIHDVYFSAFLPTISYFVSFVLILAFNSSNVTFTVSDITETAIFVAAAIGLNFIKVFPMPTGGSINFQMLPLSIIALRRGPLKGFIAGGVIYGLITCLTDGYGFATFPFDYLLGFGSVMVFGLFSPLILGKDSKGYSFSGELFLLIAGILSTTVRFIGGTVSSMVIYGYTLVPAMAYNALYIYVSGAISLAVIMIILGPLRTINRLFPTTKTEIEEK